MIKLSSSIFCHQRPTGLKTVAEEMPELLGLPQPIPLTSDITSLDSTIHHPCRIYTAVRGPVMEANETNRMLSNHRELQKRLLNMSLQGESGYFIDCFETPAAREIRNPQFT
ncbi:hypothetical protein GCK72_014373 [Caenorhabditis remanei]|uniref:Uncharacterized protein n=2 Tax=Caenorhabditis remanei TaxID=31234 RepID=A0A6A5GTJ8_CAERE|nr:hypothetical protein GCK72_014373 [Caenorhabditis remanei]KAF1757916.1 hypothetical protein GCK72_014373 [Caenorhabditis remanei]